MSISRIYYFYSVDTDESNAYAPRMTNAEQRKRRRQIAKEVKAGEKPSEVAMRHGVTLATVTSATREHGVWRKDSGFHRLSINTFKILKALIDGARQIDLARKNKCSRQNINVIAKKAICAGFLLPHYSAETSKRK